MGARGLPIFERDRVVARGKGCSRGLMHSSSGRIYDFREDEEITMFIAMVGCGIMVGKRCKCCYVDGYKVKEDLEKEDREINR